jgi:hypothetical protein
MTTARTLERRGVFTLACMAVLIIAGLIMWLASALAEPLPVETAVIRSSAGRSG